MELRRLERKPSMVVARHALQNTANCRNASGATQQGNGRETVLQTARTTKKKAQYYTDYFSVYYETIPYKQHQPVGKESGKTSYIERFNCTLRQRCSRLVRKTLSFSKKLFNHVEMIMYFVCDYNLHLWAL